jgi:hypothetical protein
MGLINGLGDKVARLIVTRLGIFGDPQHYPVFIVGCQRSGTTMLVNVFRKSPECRVYNEGNKNPAFDYYRLRSNEIVKYLIQKSKQSIVVFKPVLDSQHIDRLLDLFPHAKAVWMYRDYRDVVKSSVTKWQGDQKDIMYGIAAGIRRNPRHHQYAIADQMTESTLDLVKKLCRPDMSPADGAALLWYVRNLIYFERGLQQDHRVILIKYEDLVTDPQEYCSRIFEFIGCHFDRTYVDDIFDTSVRRTSVFDLNKEIEILCREMARRLDHQHSVQLSQSLPQINSKVAQTGR